MFKNFFEKSSGSFKGELKFLCKKILIHILVIGIIIGIYFIYR